MTQQSDVQHKEHCLCNQSDYVAVQCLQGRSMDGVPASENPVLQEVLDLRPYINSSAAAVQESFSLERTYVVFRTLGLRHLVIIDQHNHVKGIVTRKVWYDCSLLHPLQLGDVDNMCTGCKFRCLSHCKQQDRLIEWWLCMQCPNQSQTQNTTSPCC